MRIAVSDVVGVRQVELAVEPLALRFRLGERQHPVLHRRLSVLRNEPVGGIEGGGSTLRHVGDAHSAQAPKGLVARGGELHAIEGDGAAGDAAARTAETHARNSDGRFAGAGFTDEPEHLSAVELDIDPFDDLLPAFLLEALDAKALHGE